MSLYRELAHFLGWRKALPLYMKFKRGHLNQLSVPVLKFPFTIRKNNYADLATFREVILKQSYKIQTAHTPKTIIDAGGNIGLTACFFASVYPNATIVSVEPDDANFELLVENASSYNNIIPLKGGLWHRTTNLKITDPGLGANAFMVEESIETGNSLPAYSVKDIMEMRSWKQLDILKIDVEGAEKEIFSSNYEAWLPAVHHLITELHDRMKKGCSKSVFSAISNYDFEVEIAGENLVFRNHSLLPVS